MSVRKAKKLLKAEKDRIHTNKLRYTKVIWNHKNQHFICDDIWGQRTILLFT